MPSIQGQILKIYMRLKNWLQPRGAPFDLQRERKSLEDMVSISRPLGPATYTAVTAGSVPAEWIVPEGVTGQAALLYLHGGSYCAGSIHSHRALAANIAQAAGVRGLIIDYRLAPEHPFPAALDDAVIAYRWMLEQEIPPRRLAVAGDSAGGGLAVALMVQLRDHGFPLPAAAALLSPWTDLAASGDSYRSRLKRDVLLDVGRLAHEARLYLGSADPRTPLASPLYARLHGLPPLLIHAGSDELLLSDATALAERAKTAGVDVTLEVWQDMQHDWHYAAGLLPEGRQAVLRAGAFLRGLLTA